MRTGLYPVNSASQGQMLRLSRYRAARIGVDVNLHTGRWTFEQAVNYFMEAGGLDREAAEGEAAGAAASPTQKITYITGKWQIMRLLGKYRDAEGQGLSPRPVPRRPDQEWQSAVCRSSSGFCWMIVRRWIRR